MASLSTSKVFVGRMCQVILKDSGDTEKLNLEDLKPETVTVSDELKEMTMEMEDGKEIVQAYGFKTQFEMVFSHFDSTELSNIDDCESQGEVLVKTTTGGANGTGMEFVLTDCDQIRAYVDNFKTKIVAKKASSSTVRPWTISDNPA